MFITNLLFSKPVL